MARFRTGAFTEYTLVAALGLWSAYVAVLSVPFLKQTTHVRAAGDFGFFYTIGELARRDDLGHYDVEGITTLGRAIVPNWGGGQYPPTYPPQVALFFAPFAALPYHWAATLWIATTLTIYVASCLVLWRACPGLAGHGRLVAALASASPAFFYLIAFGQSSALALVCTTAGCLALIHNRPWLAGAAFGMLAFKPPLAIGFLLVPLLAGQTSVWLAGVVTASVQLLLTWALAGTDVMSTYWRNVSEIRTLIGQVDPNLALNHSLGGLVGLLVPWPLLRFLVWISLASAFVIAATLSWRSTAPLAIRFAVLSLVAVLIAPHLNVYDLVVLTPALILLLEWLLADLPAERVAIARLTLLAFVLPAIWPLAQWTHVHLAVVALGALAWRLASSATRQARVGAASRDGARRGEDYQTDRTCS